MYSSSSDIVIYFNATTQPVSQGKGESTSRILKVVMTQIWIVTMSRIVFPKIEVVIEPLS
jgi:hypothetical protein